MPYSEKELVMPAKRYNNTKRSYVLVNPKQGKHMPIDPREAVRMMETLGSKVKEHLTAESCLPALVIGFAETATAIGGVVAECLGAKYRHTTREQDPVIQNWLLFEETHSHATEQKLAVDMLEDTIADVRSIVIVDDEFTTGNTLLNMVAALEGVFPEVQTKHIVAAAIVNRVRDENLLRLRNHGIEIVALCSPDTTDEEYAAQVACFTTQAASPVDTLPVSSEPIQVVTNVFEKHLGKDVITMSSISMGKTLVLGTEEWMHYPLRCAEQLSNISWLDVRFYATTRSPIAICDREAYTVRSGFEIRSIYDEDRKIYLYNMEHYDSAIIMSNCPFAVEEEMGGVQDIARVLRAYGVKDIGFINHVWSG